MQKITTLLICVLVTHLISAQQKDYPVIGQPIPEFRLTNVYDYSRKTFDPREVKDKWIVMDFWNKSCTSCIKSLPKINKLQTEFKDDIQFLLVGKNDEKFNRNIENLYKKYEKLFELSLANAYDSILFERFKIFSVPYVIILDPQHNVYALTYGSELTHERLQELISGKKPVFVTSDNNVEPTPSWKYRQDERKTEPKDFLYRTILSEYQGEPVNGSHMIDQYIDQGLYQVIRASLSELYEIAYFGEGSDGAWNRPWNGPTLYYTHCQYPVLEIKDSLAFKFNVRDYEGLYNYSLNVPESKATKKRMMEIMQSDLRNYFGYEVTIETRMMPYWRLTATAEAREKLKTKSKTYYADTDYALGMEGKKIAVEDILIRIGSYANIENLPLIDETGIKERIDISFSAVMTDMNDVRKALRKQGLILEKAKKEMTVLVIRDPKPEDKNNK